MTTHHYPIVIRFRATRLDRKRLERIAAHYERAPSDVLRRLIAEADARLSGAELETPNA